MQCSQQCRVHQYFQAEGVSQSAIINYYTSNDESAHGGNMTYGR